MVFEFVDLIFEIGSTLNPKCGSKGRGENGVKYSMDIAEIYQFSVRSYPNTGFIIHIKRCV